MYKNKKKFKKMSYFWYYGHLFVNLQFDSTYIQISSDIKEPCKNTIKPQNVEK